MKNVDKRRDLVKDKAVWNSMRTDISDLQLARSTSEFNMAANLWNKKYSTNSETMAFQEYFHQEYIQRSKGWFEGLCLGYPTTNNALEANNRWIKAQGTLRNRLPIADMLQYLLQQAGNWSKERNKRQPKLQIIRHRTVRHF